MDDRSGGQKLFSGAHGNLRMSHRYGAGQGGNRNLPRILREYPSAHKVARLQYASDNGDNGASLLRVVWLSGVVVLCGVL